MDTLRFPSFTHGTKANVSDDAGLIARFTLNIDYFKPKPVNLPKITILLDHGDHIGALIEALEPIYPEIMTKISFAWSTKPSNKRKQQKAKRALSQQWVAESSNARMLGWSAVKVS